MDVTVTVPDAFAEGLQRCGISAENFVKLLLSDAMRIGAARERASRPEDARRFMAQSKAETEAQMRKEALDMQKGAEKVAQAKTGK